MDRLTAPEEFGALLSDANAPPEIVDLVVDGIAARNTLLLRMETQANLQAGMITDLLASRRRIAQPSLN